MFVKSTTILAILSVAARVIATPPACLIAALSSQSNPSDVSTICNNPSAVQSYIASNCGSNQQIAIGDFASVCSSAGVTVSTTLPSSSTSSGSSASGTTSVSHSSSSTTGTSMTTTSSSNTSVSGMSSADFSSSTGTASSGSQSTGSPTTMTTSVISGTGSATTPNSGVTPSSTSKTNAGNVARLGMDCLGLAALGMFGAMLAL